MSVSEPVRIVLESDGTQVEDGEYFQTLPENTIFIVLRPGEAWAPAGEDIVTQGRESGGTLRRYEDFPLQIKMVTFCKL